MKLRLAALAAIAVAAGTLLAGCKAATNVNNANATNGNTGTYNAGGPDSQPSPTATVISASTPGDAFRAYYEAIKKKDIAAVKSLFSKGTMAMMEEQATRTNKPVDTIMTEGLEAANKEVPAAFPETRNEKIDGDTATLEVRDEKADKWETLHLVKEEGSWKLAFDKRGKE